MTMIDLPTDKRAALIGMFRDAVRTRLVLRQLQRNIETIVGDCSGLEELIDDFACGCVDKNAVHFIEWKDIIRELNNILP